MKITRFITSFILLSSTNLALAAELAPVTGFGISFWSGERIPNAKLTILETGEVLQTDNNGAFAIKYPVGKPITFLFEKSGYATMQSGTFVVPKNGFTGPFDNITFQVPSSIVFNILKHTVGGKEDVNSCHVASTVTSFHKTLSDIPQGEEGAIVELTPKVDEKPFYFDIFERGPLKGKTYPFATGLKATSKDGGIAFFNLPPSDKPYRLRAIKNGVIFSEASFTCRKGAFINISPPKGPSAQL